MRFYLGTHEPSWLRRTDVPLFVSAVRLRRRKTFPRARGRWALDSGGFSELSLHGRWTVGAAQYAAEVAAWAAEVGMPDFAAIQDWMCEPPMLARTGRSVAEHQARTVDSYLELCRLQPALPWLPVVQGWRVDDYHAHIEQYRSAGVELSSLPAVGVGTVCKRQATSEASQIVRAVAAYGIRVHAFGVKSDGLRRFGDTVASADSMAWSFVARRRGIKLDGCSHGTCANCMRWAVEWTRTRIPTEPAQLSLPWEAS